MSSASPAANLKKRKAEDDVDELAPEPGSSSVPSTSPATATGSTPSPVKRGPGRPPKNASASKAAATTAASTSATGEPPVKRKRGRPPRPRTAEELEAQRLKALQPKRPRGRPRKVRPEEQAARQAALTGQTATQILQNADASASTSSAPAAGSSSAV